MAANVLSTEPSHLDSVVNADLNGQVVYLGNTVDTKVLLPGSTVKVVHYWKVVQVPGSNWRVFTHLNGGKGEWLNLDATDMRTGYPPGKWKVGDVIRDEQQFALPKTWQGPYAQLFVGLYQAGGQGIDARMKIVSGPKDQEHRVPAVRFSVGKSKAQTYSMQKAKTPIVIDGKADEADWKNAAKSPAFVKTIGGADLPHTTFARLLWDDSYLYAFIEVTDVDVASQYTKQDDPLWKEDVVELFIDADKNRRGYVELQVNPRNAHFDAWFPTTRGQTSHFEWNSNMKSAVVVHGTLDDRKDTDKGWDVEIAIPIADVMGMDKAMKIHNPPQPGDSWRLNIVRIEKPETGAMAAASWNPIPVEDFHALGHMLTVVFAGEPKSPASGDVLKKAEADEKATDLETGTKEEGGKEPNPR